MEEKDNGLPITDAEIAGFMSWRGPGAYTHHAMRRIKRIVADVVRRMHEQFSAPLTETELAERWKLTTRTLQSWRADGIGPSFIDIGRNTIRYRLCDVLAYEKTRIKHKPQGEEK